MSSQKKIVIITTLVFTCVEWLLFELIRIPYRPPHDMSTFLGTEKYAVMFMMGLIALGWLVCVDHWRLTFSFSPEEYRRLGTFFSVLMIMLSILIFFPLWPVTPFDLLW